MKITQEADYALRIAYKLALEDKICDAKSIADDTCVSLRFALKILRKFVINGLAVSYKGVNGGYKLLKPPEKITMSDILRLIDGPLDISRCLSEDHKCSRNGNEKDKCVFHNIFSRISGMIEEKFSMITLADLIDKDHVEEKIMELV